MRTLMSLLCMIVIGVGALAADLSAMPAVAEPRDESAMATVAMVTNYKAPAVVTAEQRRACLGLASVFCPAPAICLTTSPKTETKLTVSSGLDDKLVAQSQSRGTGHVTEIVPPPPKS